MENDILEFTADTSSANLRIDKYLSDVMPQQSRSYIQKLIKDEAVFVDLKPVKSNHKLKPGQSIKICLPEPVSLDIQPENIPLDIIYEDDDVILINKPKNMVVHPSAGHENHTIVNALLYHCRDNLSTINGVMRPGIVHRIDKDTTGVIIICKNDTAHQSLAAQLKVHSITRKYHAIVYNNFAEDEGTVNSRLDGILRIERKWLSTTKTERMPLHTTKYLSALESIRILNVPLKQDERIKFAFTWQV